MQVDAKRSQNRPTILQDILNVIAANPDPQGSVPTILQAVQSMTDASSVSFILFDEFQTVISIGAGEFNAHVESVKAIALQLPPGIHVNLMQSEGEPAFPFEHFIAPIYVSNTVKGALCAVLIPTYELAEDDHALLTAIVNGLTIVAMNAQVQDDQQRAYQLTSSLLSSITDPLLVLDESKHVLLMNPAAENVFKMTSYDGRGKLLADVVQSDELMALSQDKNKSHKEWTSEEGKTFVPRTEPIYDSDRHIEGWVLALRDITHFKKLIHNQHEFTRIVSHDLRSPLTYMQGFGNMLDMVGELNERQKHFVEKILTGITQMTGLVDNIQDAGRFDPESGFYEMTRSYCDVNEIIKKIADNHLVPAEKQELKLVVDLNHDVPIINADVNMLERGITNLVDNAIKYTPNGGTIQVGVEHRDDKILISVADNGFGISPENQKHLFTRHVRIARQEHKKIKGSGLGLFIVRSVAQRHGGDAWVESVEGQGSTFYMSIPLEGANLIGSQQ